MRFVPAASELRHQERRGLQNPHVLGRNMTTPIEFRLVLHGKDCVLIDKRNDKRYVLSSVRCQAIG